MIKNIFLTSICNIFRHPVFPFIHVFELAISMSLGMLIIIPLSYLPGNVILQNFAYKISYSFWLVIADILITALLGLIIHCTQTIKASVANRVKSLRTE